MPTYIQLPKLSMTMEEGSIVQWHKARGDAVRKGEVLAEVETDKATHDLEAEADGVLREVYVKEGEMVPVTTVIAAIGDADEDVPATAPDSHPSTPAAAQAAPQAQPKEQPPAPQPTGGRLKVSPVARKLAAQHGVDPACVTGSGPGGRIEKKDILRAVEQGDAQPRGASPERIVLEGMRGAIARRVGVAMREIPHIYLNANCDATNLKAARERLAPQVERETGLRPTLNDLLMQLTALALERHPRVNATLEDNAIQIHGRVDLGLVVSTGDGLLVPVVRDAARLSLRELVKARQALVEAARGGRLNAGQMEGGTFTLSNLGATGIDSFTAIINPPQVAILAVGAMRDQPSLYNGQAIIAPRMELTLGADHRALDGEAAARFLVTLRDLIEQPIALLRV